MELNTGALVMVIVFFAIRAMIPRDLQAGSILRGILLVLGLISLIVTFTSPNAGA